MFLRAVHHLYNTLAGLSALIGHIAPTSCRVDGRSIHELGLQTKRLRTLWMNKMRLPPCLGLSTMFTIISQKVSYKNHWLRLLDPLTIPCVQILYLNWCGHGRNMASTVEANTEMQFLRPFCNEWAILCALRAHCSFAINIRVAIVIVSDNGTLIVTNRKCRVHAVAL